jgi:hypothetical protein
VFVGLDQCLEAHSHRARRVQRTTSPIHRREDRAGITLPPIPSIGDPNSRQHAEKGEGFRASAESAGEGGARQGQQGDHKHIEAVAKNVIAAVRCV